MIKGGIRRVDTWKMGENLRTSLGWAKIFARRRSPGPGAACFLDAQVATFKGLTLKTLLRSVGLLACCHLDKSEATGFLGMRISHDLTLLYFTILLEEASDFELRQLWMDASDKEIRSRVDSAIICILGTPFFL